MRVIRCRRDQIFIGMCRLHNYRNKVFWHNFFRKFPEKTIFFFHRIIRVFLLYLLNTDSGIEAQQMFTCISRDLRIETGSKKPSFELLKTSWIGGYDCVTLSCSLVIDFSAIVAVSSPYDQSIPTTHMLVLVLMVPVTVVTLFFNPLVTLVLSVLPWSIKVNLPFVC